MQEKKHHVKIFVCIYLSWKLLGIHRYRCFLSALQIYSLALDKKNTSNSVETVKWEMSHTVHIHSYKWV